MRNDEWWYKTYNIRYCNTIKRSMRVAPRVMGGIYTTVESERKKVIYRCLQNIGSMSSCFEWLRHQNKYGLP